MTGIADHEILHCVPRRLADWRADENGRVVVERPRPETRGLRGSWDRLRWLMSHPRIRFDELGSMVWRRLEGGGTLAEVAAATAAALPDRAEGMEQRLALFATALHHQGLIELRVPDGD
ncbi:MAG: PqqD family peptide modification chaperone [Thermoanaerobaculales bacterium]|nr:PqqD family peptide modification chaperone [Thermoanaerobaculales bacterium]